MIVVKFAKLRCEKAGAKLKRTSAKDDTRGKSVVMTRSSST
jgi:hypothetical protein